MRYIPSIHTLVRIFIMNRFWILSNAFWHLLKWSCVFYLLFCSCGVSHWLICIWWTILVTLWWIQLNHGVWSFFICYWIWFANIFLENFCIYIRQKYWSIIFFFGSVFVWFWYQRDGNFIECLWECSLFFNLLEEFQKDQYKFFFVCLLEFTYEAIWS